MSLFTTKAWFFNDFGRDVSVFYDATDLWISFVPRIESIILESELFLLFLVIVSTIYYYHYYYYY